MANLSSAALSNFTSNAIAASNLILVNPQEDVGYSPTGTDPGFLTSIINFLLNTPPAFFFNYEGENAIQLKSDITDHFIETNYAIQNHIALRPETITVTGYVGELNDIVPSFLKPLKFVAEKLTIVSAYKPQQSVAALIAYNRALQAYQVARLATNSAVSALNSLPVVGKVFGGVQTKQQKAFTQFYGYWAKRTLFKVQTPWAVFDSMAIESLRAIQNAETRMISEFEITFKKVRVASVKLLLTKIAQGRANGQGSDEIDKGLDNMVEDQSISAQLTSSGLI